MNAAAEYNARIAQQQHKLVRVAGGRWGCACGLRCANREQHAEHQQAVGRDAYAATIARHAN
jgi:hypothetical protein